MAGDDYGRRRRAQRPARARAAPSSASVSIESVGMAAEPPEPTKTTAVLELLFGSGSGVKEETAAVFERDPAAAITRTEIVTVADAPTPSVPKSAVTVPLVPMGGPEQIPRLEAQERKTVPAGRGSVSRALTAACGPALDTTIW